MRRYLSSYLLPVIALLALGVLAGGLYYKQNFDTGIRFPYLGNADDSLDCKSIDRENLVVILAVGQSIASNYGSTPYRPGPHVFSFYNGRCFPGHDPLPGADGAGGSIWSRLGDLLVQRGHAKSVLLVAVGAGGSSVAEWVPGGKLHARLIDAGHSMKLAGISPSMVIWHQGSRDARMDPDAYRNYLRELVDSFPFLDIRLGQPTRLLIATHTRCKSPPVEALRAAQHSLVDHNHYIYEGPDMDVVDDGMKYDDCHYNEAGLNFASQKWLDAIERADADVNWLPRLPPPPPATP